MQWLRVNLKARKALINIRSSKYLFAVITFEPKFQYSTKIFYISLSTVSFHHLKLFVERYNPTPNTNNLRTKQITYEIIFFTVYSNTSETNLASNPFLSYQRYRSILVFFHDLHMYLFTIFSIWQNIDTIHIIHIPKEKKNSTSFKQCIRP